MMLLPSFYGMYLLLFINLSSVNVIFELMPIKDNNIKITIKAKIYGFFMLEGTRFSAV